MDRAISNNLKCPRFIVIIFHPHFWPGVGKWQFTHRAGSKLVEYVGWYAATAHEIADQMCVSQILSDVNSNQDS